MDPQTPFSTPVKSAAEDGLNRASLGFNIATKFKLKAEAAKHRLEQKKMDEIIENTSVLVAVRVRPLNKRELRAKSSVNVIPSSKTSLSVLGENQYDDTRNFTFDAVLPERSTQKKAYDLTAKRILMKALDGFNGCIFAYGQTGSGKTYTMQGLPGLPGIIPRLSSDLFKYKEKNKASAKFTIKASYVEIYNERIRDLIGKNSNVSLRENTHTGDVQMLNCQEILLETEKDVQKVLTKGQKNRTTASTNMNEASSRSHAILTLFIKQHSLSSGIATVSKLSLIDLAGSERQKNTGATGEKLKEGAAINKSLSALGNVVNALTSEKMGKHSKKKHHKNSTHVPYRDSKLTRLLQDSLGGNSFTLMICNVSPAKINQDETISSLKFADRAKKIQNKAKKNVTGHHHSDDMVKIMAENENLKNRIKLLSENSGHHSSASSSEKHKGKILQLEKELEICHAELTKVKEANKSLDDPTAGNHKRNKSNEGTIQLELCKMLGIDHDFDQQDEEQLRTTIESAKAAIRSMRSSKASLEKICEVFEVPSTPSDAAAAINSIIQQYQTGRQCLKNIVKGLSQFSKGDMKHDMIEEAEIDAKSVNFMVSNFISKFESKEADAHEYEAKNRKLKDELQSVQKDLNSFEKNYNIVNNSLELKTKECLDSNQLNSQMQSILKEAKEEISRLKSAVYDEKKDKLNFESKVKDTEKRNKALNDKIAELNGAMNKSKERIASLESSLESAELERGKLQAKCNDIDANIVPKLNNQIQKLKREEESRNEELLLLRKIKDELDVKLDNQKKESKVVGNELRELNDKHEKMAQSFAELNAAHKSLILEKEQISSNVRLLQTSNDRLKGVHKDYDDVLKEFEKLKLKYEKEVFQRKNLKAEIIETVKQRDTHKRDKNTFSQRLEGLMIQHKQLESVIERMKLTFRDDSDMLKSEHKRKIETIFQDHSKQLEEMAEIHRGKDNEVKQLKMKLQTAGENETLLESLKTKVVDLKESSNKKDIKLEDLSRKYKRETDKVKLLKVELQSTVEQIEAEISQSKSQKALADSEASKLRKELSESQLNQSKLQSNINVLTEMHERSKCKYEDEMRTTTNYINQLKKENASFQSVIKSQKSEADKKSSELESVYEKIRKYEKDHEQTKQICENLQADSDEKSRLLSSLSQNMKVESQKLVDANIELRTVNGKLRSSERELERLKNHMDYLKKKYEDTLAMKNKNSEDQLRALKTQLEETRERYVKQTDASKSKEKDLKHTNKLLEEHNNELLGANEKLLINLNDVSSRLAAIQIDHDEQSHTLSQSKITISKMRSKIEEVTRLKEKLESEVTALTAENNALKNMNDDLENEAQNDLHEISNLQTVLNKKDNDLEQCRTKLKEIQIESEKNAASFREAQNEITSLRESNQLSASYSSKNAFEMKSAIKQATGSSASDLDPSLITTKTDGIENYHQDQISELDAKIQHLELEKEKQKQKLDHVIEELNAKEKMLKETREVLQEESSKYAKAHAQMTEKEGQCRALERALKKTENASEFKIRSLQDALASEKHNLENEIALLKEKVDSLTKELRSTVEETDKLEYTQQHLSAEKNEIITALEENNETLQFEVSKMRQDNDSISLRLREAEDSALEMIQKHGEVADQLQRSQILNQDLQVELDSTKANRDKMEQELNDNIETIKLLNESLIQKKQSLEQCEAELRAKSAELESFKSDIYEIKDDDIISVKGEREIDTNLSFHDNDNEMTARELSQTKSGGETSTSLRKAHESFLSIQKKYNDVQEELSSLRISNATLVSELENAKHQNQEKISELSTLKKTNLNLNEECKSLEKIVRQIRIEKASLEQEVNLIQMTSNMNLKQADEKLNRVQDGLKKQLDTERNILAILRQEIEDVQIHNDEEQKRVSKATEEQFEEYTATILNLESQLQDARVKEAEMAIISNTNNELQEKLQTAEETLASLRNNIKVLSDNLGTKEKESKTLEESISILKTKLFRKEEELAQIETNNKKISLEKDNAIAQLEKDINDVRKELTHSQKKQRSSDEHIRQLKSSISTDKHRQVGLKQKIETLEKVIVIRNDDNEKNQGLLKDLRQSMKNEHMKYVELNTKLVEMTLKLESADNIKRKCLSLEAELEESRRMSESIRIERDDIQKMCQEQKSALDYIDSQNYQEKYEAAIIERDELRKVLEASSQISRKTNIIDSGSSESRVLTISHLNSTPTVNPTVMNNNDAHSKLLEVFDIMDRNNDGVVNVREMILALRHDEKIAQLLRLPSHIKQEDGSRNKLEDAFQEMDEDGTREFNFDQFKQYMLKHGMMESQNIIYHSQLGVQKGQYEGKDLHMLEEELENSENLQKTLKTELESAEKAMISAKNELAKERKQNEETSKMVMKLKEQIDLLREKVEKYEIKDSLLEQENDHLKESIRVLENDSSATMLKIESQRQEIASYERNKAANEGNESKLERMIDDFKSQIQIRDGTIDKLKSEIEYLRASTTQAREANIALSASVKQLQNHITTLTSENETQKKKIENLNAEIRISLQNGSELLNLMQIESANKSQTKESASNDTLSSLLSKLQNAYKVVHKQFSEEKETLQARNRYMEITMTRLHEAKLTIDKHLKELETNIKTSRTRISDLEQENRDLMSQREVLEEKVQEQESKITAQDDALSRERNDKREAREAISKAVEKSNERIQEVKTLHNRIQKLETQLEKAVKQNRKLLDELHETSRLYHQTKRRTEEIQRANDQHAHRDLELRRAISTKLNSLHNAESNLLAESELARSSRTNMYRNVQQAGK